MQARAMNRFSYHKPGNILHLLHPVRIYLLQLLPQHTNPDLMLFRWLSEEC